jgi:hypothetical protein
MENWQSVTTKAKMIPLEGKEIRVFEINKTWFFAVDDVVEALRDDVGFFRRLAHKFIEGRDQRNFADLVRELKISVSEHKALKGLKKDSGDLRENMTHLELIFCSLGEASSTAISQTMAERSSVPQVKHVRPVEKSLVMHEKHWKRRGDETSWPPIVPFRRIRHFPCPRLPDRVGFVLFDVVG